MVGSLLINSIKEFGPKEEVARGNSCEVAVAMSGHELNFGFNRVKASMFDGLVLELRARACLQR